VITHVGEGGDAFKNSLSSPKMIRDITKQFPDLRLMACHFGGYKILDDAEEMLAGADVVLETSWPPSLATLRPERVRDLIRKHGAERIVFGSDWPMTSPAEEIRAIECEVTVSPRTHGSALFQRGHGAAHLRLVHCRMRADFRGGHRAVLAEGRQRAPFRPGQTVTLAIEFRKVTADRIGQPVQAVG
jgi:predicted TIM-barrel fold metal-dependent hydrolase